MEQRIAFTDGRQGLLDGLFRIGMHLRKSELDHKLQELIKTRASQINGCAYCLDMHWKDAIALGETEQRLYSLPAWRECPYYTDAERAALAYTEAVTKIPQTDVTDEVFNELSKHFDKAQIADITMAIVAINSWNRLNVAFRTIPGDYTPGNSISAKAMGIDQ